MKIIQLALGQLALGMCCVVILSGGALAQAGTNTPTGVVQTQSGPYNFAPAVCAVHIEDGEPDIEISGPGTSPDGEKIFVDFSSTANELTIALGVDRRFSSSDRELKAGQYVTEKFDIEVSGSTIRVPGLVLADASGARQPGSLEIKCAPRN